MNKTIRVSNVQEKDSQYGKYLRIGYKVGDTWENYNAKMELAGVLVKGAQVAIEYETTKSGGFKITGAAPVGGSTGSKGSEFRTPEQILRDGVVQHVVGLAMNRTDLVPDETAFFYWLEKVYEWTTKKPLEALKEKAIAELDAVEEDDDIPF